MCYIVIVIIIIVIIIEHDVRRRELSMRIGERRGLHVGHSKRDEGRRCSGRRRATHLNESRLRLFLVLLLP